MNVIEAAEYLKAAALIAPEAHSATLQVFVGDRETAERIAHVWAAFEGVTAEHDTRGTHGHNSYGTPTTAVHYPAEVA
jgi:hypothetical protein